MLYLHKGAMQSKKKKWTILHTLKKVWKNDQTFCFFLTLYSSLIQEVEHSFYILKPNIVKFMNFAF